jgi:hypothetical protein
VVSSEPPGHGLSPDKHGVEYITDWNFYERIEKKLIRESSYSTVDPSYFKDLFMYKKESGIIIPHGNDFYSRYRRL